MFLSSSSTWVEIVIVLTTKSLWFSRYSSFQSISHITWYVFYTLRLFPACAARAYGSRMEFSGNNYMRRIYWLCVARLAIFVFIVWRYLLVFSSFDVICRFIFDISLNISMCREDCGFDDLRVMFRVVSRLLTANWTGSTIVYHVLFIDSEIFDIRSVFENMMFYKIMILKDRVILVFTR